jgi:GTP-binding protein EngB required for normal cell division
MSDANSLHSEIELLRQRVIQTIEELQRKSQSFSLPSPPSSLEDHLLKLKANSYHVLVVGEAKRGKSSFVNALIGRDILPTGVAVTTSQVFLVRSASFEAYHLRFEDNSEREIGQNNLAEYGSQVLANIKGLPSLDQIIRWIEVDSPVKYLPRGVNILDTPGLGSLYSAHAQITRRFLPLADAVLFVLDSDQTMLQSELTFIEMILDITKNIFFIQTKIDHYRPEKWQELQRRHQEVITQHFKDRLIDRQVWPISSKSLLKSMQDEDDSADYLLASKYPQLSLALQVFLFRISGLERARVATGVAKSYCEMTKAHLSAHLANVLEQSEQKQQDLQQNIAQRTRLFDAEWGAYGRKREELLSNINNVLHMHKQLFLQELHQGGGIETSQRNKINGLKSFEEAKQYSKTLDEQLVNFFLDNWHQICQQAQRECGNLLLPFFNAASAVSIPIMLSPETVVTGEVDLNARVNWDWIIEKAGQEIHFLFGVLSFVLPLPNMIATLATLFWAGIRAWSYREEARLEDAKQQLNEHLTVTLQTIMQSFIFADAASGHKNRVDVYFDALRSTMLEQVQRIATQKSLEAQKELDHLSKEATLNEQQRKIRAEQLQQQLTEWDGIYQATRDLQTELENMDRLLSVFSTYTRD